MSDFDNFKNFIFSEREKIYRDCSVFRGPIVTMKRVFDDEWLLVDSETDEILFIGSKEKILDEYDRRNQIERVKND